MTDIKLYVEDAEAFFSRARTLAKALDEGGHASPEDHLSFGGLETLLRLLSPARWALLRALKRQGASSIRELAFALGRDDESVRSDIEDLVEAGLIERDAKDRVGVPWSRVLAEADLRAA